MLLLPDVEIDSMAQEAINAMPDTISIYRNTGGDNQEGGETAGKTIIGQNIPARLSPVGVRSSLAVFADRLEVKLPWQVTIPADTDVESEDEITWRTRRFQVVQPIERSYEVTRKLLCNELVD